MLLVRLQQSIRSGELVLGLRLEVAGVVALVQLARRLAESKYVAGDTYTIADIAIFPWYGGLAKFNSYGAAEFLAVHEYKNVQRWADTLLERPAVRRGRMVNRLSGKPSSQLHERHDASDFETKTQDKLAAAN